MGGGSDDNYKKNDEGLDADRKEAKKLRSSLTKTEGGVLGQELTEDEVKKRPNIYGN